MKFKCKTQEVKPIFFETEDEKQYECKFNVKAFRIIDEECNEGSIVILSRGLLKPYLYGTKIIYAGLKACDDNVTEQIAENIVYSLELEDITKVIKLALENFQGEMGKEKNKRKELTAQDLKIAKNFLGL